MGKHNFSMWLYYEVHTARYALLVLYEKRDQLMYVEAPALRAEYEAKVGIFEKEVLKSELKADMLERKIVLIQKAINRREPIDMEKIEQQLEEEKRQRMDALKASNGATYEIRQLCDEEQEELQSKYRQIIQDFHPEVHKGISNTQRELYNKALEAYKHRDIEAIRIIYDMLYEKGKESYVTTEVDESEEGMKKALQKAADALAEDYSLAGELYANFTETERDAVLKNLCDRCKQQRDELYDEITEIQNSYPFNAKEVLSKPEAFDEYKSELMMRLRVSEKRIKDLTTKVESMIGAA